LFALALAQTKPVWPQAASASIFVEGWSERREDNHFFRWFWDEAAGKERIDGPQRFQGEFYWTTLIADTVAKKEALVVRQGSLTSCFVRPYNRSLPNPNFANARFVGKAEIGYRVVDHWVERSPQGNDIAQIYDRSDNYEIVRIDVDRNGRALTVNFHEIDVGPQSPTLWILPDAILAICNTVPAEKEHLFDGLRILK
jgi:hypothetical protein